MQVGQLVNAEPSIFFENEDGENYKEEGGHPALSHGEIQNEKAKAAVILVRMNPDDIKAEKEPRQLGGRGHLVLFEDLHPRGLPDLVVGTANSSPAVPMSPVHLRPGRQRPSDLRTRSSSSAPTSPRSWTEGYLVAQSDFTEPVGPSFWERG
jgi:ubiquinol-cytochrome c reductase iron-sulfur subunit